MAWFSFICKEHGKFTLSLIKREKSALCPKCNLKCDAIISLGTTQIIERLDNGAMARAVERLHNIEDIMAERSNKFSEKESDELADD
jgi:plasmid rolling circle replication initiator protein Rep